MKFVLIALLLQGDIPVSVMGIFPSEATCEAAIEKLKEGRPKLKAACFPQDGSE